MSPHLKRDNSLSWNPLRSRGRAIAGHDDLLAGLVKLIKNMEEHLRVFSRPARNCTSSRIRKIYLQVKILELLDLVVLEGRSGIVLVKSFWST